MKPNHIYLMKHVYYTKIDTQDL